jgi:hypothetical protein
MMKIEIGAPEHKGIASYAWSPMIEKDQSSIVTVAMFGGTLEHWNTSNSSSKLTRVQGGHLPRRVGRDVHRCCLLS